VKTDQAHFEGPIEKLLAVPNRSQKALGNSCSSQQWQPRRLGCVSIFGRGPHKLLHSSSRTGHLK